MNALTGGGRTRIMMWDSLRAGTANVVRNFALIPEYGIVGTAPATALSYTALNVCCSVQLYRTTGIRPSTAALFKPAITGGTSMLTIYYVVTRFLKATAMVLFGMGTVFLALYAVAILALRGSRRKRSCSC